MSLIDHISTAFRGGPSRLLVASLFTLVVVGGPAIGADAPLAEPPGALPASTEYGPGGDEGNTAGQPPELNEDEPLGTEVTPPEVRDALMARVQRRWDALIGKDFRAAYELESPDFRKANKPEDYYPLGPMARWHVAKVKDVRYHGPDLMVATVELEYSFPLGASETWVRTHGTFKERWVRVDGEWWHQQERRTLGDRGQSDPSRQ